MIDAVPAENSPDRSLQSSWPTASQTQSPPGPRVDSAHRAARSSTQVCGGCGCWCDDIPLPDDPVAGGQPACGLGQQFFQGLRTAPHTPEPSLDELVLALQHARCPLFTGLQYSDVDTQRWAVALADLCRGRIDPFLSPAARAKTMAFQQGGDVSATWGEVKNRADLIIYWRCQPQQAPRFRSRYGDLAAGQFVQADQRQVFVLDQSPDPNAWESIPSDHLIALTDHDPFTFEALARASQAAPAAIDPLPDHWQPLLTAIEQAKYIAIVVGHLQVSTLAATEPTTELATKPTIEPTSQTAAGADHRHTEHTSAMDSSPESLAVAYQALQRWVTAHNQVRRCVAVPFPDSAEQGLAAQAVLTWRTGYPLAVDFSTGQPRSDVIAYRWETAVERNEVDLVVCLGPGLALGNPHAPAAPAGPDVAERNMSHAASATPDSSWAAAYERLRQWSQTHPVWELGNQAVVGAPARFVCTSGQPNHDTPPPIISRPDGVWLPLRSPPAAPVNRQAQVLQELWQRLVASTPSRPTPADDRNPT
jgi:formylmethanofuran dehydrogenase subunit B